MRRMNTIYAKSSHYEILDYELNDNPKLERALTYYDYVAFKNNTRYLYDKDKKIFYVPRGFDCKLLEQWNGKPITYDDLPNKGLPIDFIMLRQPRDEYQEKAVRFLTNKEEFKKVPISQKALIMPPGTGKTYCAICAVNIIRERTLIIVNTHELKQQWIDRIEEYTNLGGPNIVDIDSSDYLKSLGKCKLKQSQMLFITTRSLLVSYMDRYGMEDLDKTLHSVGIGVKIFDEVHKEYYRILQIDYATNIRRTFYLTGTFELSNTFENRVFQNAFNLVSKCEIIPDYEKHIVYIPVVFNSYPNALVSHKVCGKKRGFDRYAYIDYELQRGILEKSIRYIMDFFIVQKKVSGKTLLLSSKKTSCDILKDIVIDVTNGEYSTCSFYTGNKTDDYREFDCVCATPSMFGTGTDITGLRFMLNTEPFSSAPNTEQFPKRLRPYGDGSPTYYIEFVDIGFDKVYEWYRKRTKFLEKKVKEIHEMRLNDRTVM